MNCVCKRCSHRPACHVEAARSRVGRFTAKTRVVTGHRSAHRTDSSCGELVATVCAYRIWSRSSSIMSVCRSKSDAKTHRRRPHRRTELLRAGHSQSLRETECSAYFVLPARRVRELLLECALLARRVRASPRRFQRVGELRRWQSRDEICNRFENSLINLFLRFTRRLELPLRHTQ